MLTQKSPRFPSLTPGTLAPLNKLLPAAPVAPAVPIMLNWAEPQPPEVFGPYNMLFVVLTQKSPMFPSLVTGALAPLNILRPSTPLVPLVPFVPSRPAAPVRPVRPCKPCAPCKPCGPVAPGSPFGPAAPVKP